MNPMMFKYVRIQGKELARNTMYAKGIFSMCWQLIQDDVMEQEDADLYREIDGWFAEHLPAALQEAGAGRLLVQNGEFRGDAQNDPPGAVAAGAV